MAALKTCSWWKVDYFYFGILVVTHDAQLKGSGFTVCVFSASFTSWPSTTEFCPEMPPEPLSGSHGPSTEAPTSVVVSKRGCGNWCTGLWRYSTAWGSLISKWVSEYALVKDQRKNMRADLSLPDPWGSNQASLRTTNEVFVNERAKTGSQKKRTEILCQNPLGCYRLKGQRSALLEVGPQKCGAASFRGHLT